MRTPLTSPRGASRPRGPGRAPPRRSIAAPPSVDPGLFDSPSPLRVVDEPQPIAVFDKAALPEDYETCYRENALRTHLKITAPYDAASFPPNFAPPEFRWQDRLDEPLARDPHRPRLARARQVRCLRRAWRPDAALWSRVTTDAKGKSVEYRSPRDKARKRQAHRRRLRRLRLVPHLQLPGRPRNRLSHGHAALPRVQDARHVVARISRRSTRGSSTRAMARSAPTATLSPAVRTSSARTSTSPSPSATSWATRSTASSGSTTSPPSPARRWKSTPSSCPGTRTARR